VVEIQFWIFDTAWFISLFAFIAVALSLNLEAGYTGIPNFGKAVFVFVGAWAAAGIGVRIAALLVQLVDPAFAREALQGALAAYPGYEVGSLVEAAAQVKPNTNKIIVSDYLIPYYQEHVGLAIALFIILIAVTVVLAAVFGLAASYAAVRLKEDYLAILLLAFSEAMVSVLFDQNMALNGGTQGLWAITFTSNPLLFSLALTAAIAVLTFIYAERIGNSPMGRAMRAVRDNEVAAEVFGRDVARIRLKVIVVAAIIAALAGFAYAQGNSYVRSANYTRVIWTFIPWAMIILGGMANNKGVVLGVIVFMVGKRIIEAYSGALDTILGLEQGVISGMLPNIFTGILILAVLFFRPQGILPEQPSKTADFKRILEETPEAP